MFLANSFYLNISQYLFTFTCSDIQNIARNFEILISTRLRNKILQQLIFPFKQINCTSSYHSMSVHFINGRFQSRQPLLSLYRQQTVSFTQAFNSNKSIFSDSPGHIFSPFPYPKLIRSPVMFQPNQQLKPNFLFVHFQPECSFDN